MALLFVDTNVLLDFYRYKTDAGIGLLDRLESLSDRLIMSHQVEMEFKKHRLKVMVESVKALRAPDRVETPAFLRSSRTASALARNIEAAKTRVKQLTERMQEALDDPAGRDPVYQGCQRLFRKRDDLTLFRGHSLKPAIWRKAMRRFFHGCPPRKSSDTSMGDALNWEWIVNCGERLNADVHIVSRDGDYGVEFDKRCYINDHLRQEFKDRVGSRRNIYLHQALTSALKILAVRVTPAMVTEEAEVVAATPESDSHKAGSSYMSPSLRALYESLAKLGSGYSELQYAPPSSSVPLGVNWPDSYEQLFGLSTVKPPSKDGGSDVDQSDAK